MEKEGTKQRKNKVDKRSEDNNLKKIKLLSKQLKWAINW